MVARIGSRVAVFLVLGVPIVAEEPLAEVKVTQGYVEPVCLDGAPIKPGERDWRLGVGPIVRSCQPVDFGHRCMRAWLGWRGRLPK